MKRLGIVLLGLALLGMPAKAEPPAALSTLKALPRADVSRLLGSWEVAEMAPLKMIYEFQAGTMAMHGKNAELGSTFELTMDADYRSAGADAIWVIATHPHGGPDEEPPTANGPSIMGVQLTGNDRAILVVSTTERFTLIKVP